MSLPSLPQESSNQNFDTGHSFRIHKFTTKQQATHGNLRQLIRALQKCLMLRSDKIIHASCRIRLYGVDLGFNIPLQFALGVYTCTKGKEFFKSRESRAWVSQL